MNFVLSSLEGASPLVSLRVLLLASRLFLLCHGLRWIFFPASSFPTLYFLLLLPVSNPPLSVHGLERLRSSVLFFACLILGGTAGACSSFTFLIGLLAILRYMISRRRFGWFCAFVTCLISFLEQDAWANDQKCCSKFLL